MRVLIVGCGYLGLPLGERLAEAGHAVFGVRKAPGGEEQLRQKRIEPLLADITDPESLNGLPGPFDWVVNCVSSTRGGEEVYRQVYLEGTRNLVRALAGSGLDKYVFTSSTSVYGQTDGSLVEESSPTNPASATSRILVETERFLQEAARWQGFPAVVLRLAGIYGPGRGYLFHQYLKGEARIHGQGERWINMVHLEDVVEAAVAALEKGKGGEIYNVVDDEPVTQIEFYRWLAAELGKEPPPVAEAAENAGRKRGLTHKRVANRKLKADLGCRFKYPTFREGYRAEIQRVGQIRLADGKLAEP